MSIVELTPEQNRIAFKVASAALAEIGAIVEPDYRTGKAATRRIGTCDRYRATVLGYRAAGVAVPSVADWVEWEDRHAKRPTVDEEAELHRIHLMLTGEVAA